MFIKILLFVIFFGIMLGVGIYSRRHAVSVDSFILGGRSVGPWLSAFAYGTTYFSAVVFVGYAGQFGWKFGMSALWIGLGNAIIGSLLAWVVLGKRARRMTKHLNATTMPDFFAKRFDSKALKVMGAVISFIFLVPYTASVYNGLSRLFSMAFNIDFMYCVIAMAVLTGIYVLVGGYMALAINDFIQGIIMIGGIIAVIATVLSGYGGFTQAVAELAQGAVQVTTGSGHTVTMNGAFTSMFGPAPLSLLSVVVLTSLGTWGLPQMIHKFYTIKSDKAIRAGTVISTVFALIVAGGSYFLGSFSRLSVDPSQWSMVGASGQGGISFDSLVPSMLSSLPDVLIGIVVILVLSASMSTLSSLVLVSSSTITLDFINGTIVKDMTEKTKLLIMRILIAVFVLVSVVIALNPNVLIAQLMGISWGALAGSFLAPFLYGLFWKGTTKAGVFASFIFGVGLTVVNMVFPIFDSPITAGAVAMVGGLVVLPAVSVLTPKLKKDHVESAFSCYEQDSSDI